ncbi:TauD/TfdA family dioxygenase [Streptomyces spectabilis]|uniref:TauD/TfdA family dioxygenase n=1 Tax=Streptomyces spectabilis TaxID=68270 RepID=A0A516R3K6_STRST|nr:TauD/TfdA family dioxygenase [Streptomyces spectabilis]QDQ10240.1 TauD/TfdA family dioxygenase [Streptomyces spectabilis]
MSHQVEEVPAGWAGAGTLPGLHRPKDPGTRVQDYIHTHRAALRAQLTERGALLLRGFDVAGVDGFDGAVRAFSGTPPLAYAERSSPRSTIKGQVYTSTDYPPDEEIFLHNENSYQAVWPRALYFYCVEPPTTQGATPLADTRQVLRSLDPEVRDEFERRGWQVVRNFHPGFGVPWQEAFNTTDKAAVTAYCAEHDITAEWRPGGGLRTTAVRRAVHRHPGTGEQVWFNHATFFNLTTLAKDVSAGLRAIFDDPDLPTHTYYGDGGAIPDAVTDQLRAAYRAATVRFDWQRDDVLIVDNMLTAHAREPFTGPRRIAVAMAEPSDA